MEYENTPYNNNTPSYPRKRRKKKKTPIFRRTFFAYVVVLVLCCIAAVVYVRKSLVLFENSQSNVYMDNFVSNLSADSELSNLIESEYFSSAALSKFDDVEACKQQFNSKIDSSLFTYKISSQSYDTSMPIYDVYADEALFMTVTLKSINSETRLGIMTISEWEIQNIVLRSGNSSESGSLPGLSGTFEYTISAPSTYKVYVNNIELGNDELTGETKAIEEFQYASEYVKMPELVTYHIDGLIFEPEIVIKNNAGEDVEYTIKNSTIQVKPEFKSSQEAEKMAEAVDALNIAKTWSKFMTADLSGTSYGVGQVQQYFIKNSYLYNMAYEYAGSVDITFVSSHVIDSFTGESVSNYLKYSDECFSCDVYFEKNMTLTKTGDKRTDIFNSRMYFVYVDDSSVASPGWYLVDMQAIID